MVRPKDRVSNVVIPSFQDIARLGGREPNFAVTMRVLCIRDVFGSGVCVSQCLNGRGRRQTDTKCPGISAAAP